MDPYLLQDLDVEQKRVLICQEFERMQRIARMDAKVLLGKVAPARLTFSELSNHPQTRRRCSFS